MREMNPRFSIIVPTLDNLDDLEKLILSINSQTLLPEEVVIADSSSTNDIQNRIDSIPSAFDITYIRVGRAYPYDRFLRYIFSLPVLRNNKKRFPKGRAFPYEATNAGVDIAQNEWIGFLDATTIPKNSWLKDYWGFVSKYKCDVVLGNTKYFAESKFQKLLRASTYGRRGHETAPGSIIKKVNFLNGFKIMEGVRSGGDVAWKNSVKENFKYFSPEKHYLKYSNLSKNIFPALKKFFVYQIYTSFVDIQHNVKDIYLALTLILSIIIVPKWNYIVGWDSPMFIPHITKVFFICVLLIITITFLINRTVFRTLSNSSFLANLSKLSIFMIITFCIYNWNAVVAKWVEDSIWYIPHITKIFLLSIIGASFVYRGIYFPIKNKIKLNYLFPFNWILVGFLGIALDIVKAPGYILGAIFATFLSGRK